MKYISFIIILLNIFFIGCKKDPTGPDCSPGKRDYKWSVDTLHLGTWYIEKLWGSAPNDVWGISSANEDSKIFHYDGNRWSTTNITNIGPTAIFGFSKNNIWIADQQGQFWHYDGQSWVYSTTLNISSEKKIYWDNIWGESSENIYATGVFEDSARWFSNGALAHYDGQFWTIVDTIFGKSLYKIYKNKLDNELYLFGGHISSNGDSTYILKYTNTNFNTISSGGYGKNNFQTISLVGTDLFFIRGRNISFFNGTSFLDLNYIAEPNYDNALCGRSPLDLFLLMTDGLAHYNGSDIKYLYSLPANTGITDMLIFNSTIFFSAHIFGTDITLIVKGTL